MGGRRVAIYLPSSQMSTLKTDPPPPPPPNIKKDKLNPLPTSPIILLEQSIGSAQCLPCGFVNATNREDLVIPNTRCFTIAAAQALFAYPKIASFLRYPSVGNKRNTVADRTELSNCYTCDLASARDFVYTTRGRSLFPQKHALWTGGPWAKAYPEFEKTARGNFPSSPQQSAKEYLDYASCLFSRSESFAPVGTCDRPNGEYDARKSARAPRSSPLFYIIPPLNPTDTSIQSIQTILLHIEISGEVLPAKQDRYRFLAALNTGAICTDRIPSCPSANDVAARACQAEVLAICLERNSGTSKIRPMFPSESHNQYSGFLWQFASAVQHIGEDASSGHHVGISETGPG